MHWLPGGHVSIGADVLYGCFSTNTEVPPNKHDIEKVFKLG